MRSEWPSAFRRAFLARSGSCSTASRFLAWSAGGYQTGVAGSKRSIARPIIAFSFALSFALVFALIAALDRPESGVIRVTQQPLIDLYDSMTAASERVQ